MKILIPFMTLIVLYSITLNANENNNSLDSYISEYKKQEFRYDYKKVEYDSLKLRDSWIAPLKLNYSYSKSKPNESVVETKNTSIKMDQTIFASGGIYYGIKYAEASQKYSNYSVDMAKRKLVKEAVSLLMQIKQMDLKIKRQSLQIENSDINLEQKTEQYLSGQLDSGFFNNAVIDRNSVIQISYDILTNKQRLISRFNALSDLNYKDAYTPRLSMLSEEEFLKHNIVLSIVNSDIDKTLYKKDMTISNYLPHVNLIAGYNWEDQKIQRASQQKRDYYNYGFRATMPIDINTFRDIESSRVEYLKSKVVVVDKKRELKAIYEQVMQNIENFEKKKALSLENSKIYEKLLYEIQEMYSAGYKTAHDVSLLENSFEIQTIDSEIFEIDKQLELLTLYEMYINDKN